jgi:putative holliday junction resolvase
MEVFLCLDLGEKRIGIAVGSFETRLPMPLDAFEHKSRKLDIEKVRQMAEEHCVTNIVIGISLQEDGTLNSMGRHSVSFGSDLEKATAIPVVYWDESLSTRDAKDLRLETGASRKNRRGHQDSLAAVIILRSYFENLTNKESSPS